MNILKLAGFALPLLLAVDAAAAIGRVMPVPTRINPLVGLPTYLPSPLTGPLAGRGVVLPSPVMTPTLVTRSLLTVTAPRLVVNDNRASAAEAVVSPRAGKAALDENVAMPAVMPEAALRLSAAADAPKSREGAAQVPEDLRDLFDGARRKPSEIRWDPIFPRQRKPRRDRRFGLPEDELERELGIDSQF